MPNIPCALALNECLPCNDSPIANLSAEAPDIDVFIAFRDFRGNPPLGVTYAQLGCKTICFSAVSQQQADDCAQRQAQECVWRTWEPPRFPPVPPGPDDTGGKGQGPNTPGKIPPNRPRNPVQRFLNSAQTCDQPCPDGTPFTGTVDAGTIVALSQVLADEQAQSLACKRALRDRICFASTALPGICIEEIYLFQLQASGGTNFATHDYDWSIVAGSLPPGIELDPFFGLLSGLPIVGGRFTFTVQIVDAIGRSQSKEFSICIMEIVTGATLPPATDGQLYNQALIQEPATVASEVWSVIEGSLPPGITLSEAGVLVGTPTEIGVSEFTVQVNADCGTCFKSFSLEVESGVDCMGVVQAIEDCVWTLLSLPANGTINITGGDATYTAAPNVAGIGIEVTTEICNPSLDPYPFTVDFAWTVAGGGPPVAGQSQATVRLNGVTTNGPLEVLLGAFTWHFDGILLPGVNTLNLVTNGSFVFPPFTVNGTIQVRPLTPP